MSATPVLGTIETVHYATKTSSRDRAGMSSRLDEAIAAMAMGAEVIDLRDARIGTADAVRLSVRLGAVLQMRAPITSLHLQSACPAAAVPSVFQ